MAKRHMILDAWTSLAHKAPLRDEQEARLRGWEAKSWLPAHDKRRLAAYMVLAAYEGNSAREFIDVDGDPGENREYGDAALIVDQVLAHLLGESQEIVVPGAEDFDPNTEPDVEGDGNQTQAAFLADRQEFLRKWAEDVHMTLRLVDGERNSVNFGDNVYLLGWDDRTARPTCAVMDPGFYFPVLPDSIDAYEYPTKVHFAWELPAEDYPDNKPRLRRLTYELRRLELVDSYDPETFEDLLVLPEDTDYVGGKIVRTYPWSDKPSEWACFLTDATWRLDDIDDAAVDALTSEHAQYRVNTDGVEVRDFDLGIDCIPIIHVPNTPAGGQHYGQSSLSRVLQILDDLQNADTDAQRASATTGSPIIGVSGAKVGGDPTTPGGQKRKLVVTGGAVWELGENGSLHVVKTAENLAELRNFVQSLRDRMSVNSRLPAAVLGMMDPSEVPSGYAMQLSFGPLSAMIRQMRLTRNVKYPLLLKMVQRLYQANGGLPPGETPRAEIRLGSYLPSDMKGTLDLVATALEKKIISLETAIGMLVDVGFPIEDIAEEIKRIQSRDFAGANELADATGDAAAVAEYLGRSAPVDAPIPAVPLPIPGGGNAGAAIS